MRNSPRLPRSLEPISARQLVEGARENAGRRNLAASLATLTNRGNTLQYQIVSGVAPQRTQIVSDTGDSVHGDGMSWILSVEKPLLISGVYDPGLAIEVSFGVGGARETILLNAAPGFELVIPADAVNVYVLSLTNPPVALNSVTRIAALLHRGVPSGTENAHLSFVAPAAAGAIPGLNIPIPSFANDMGIYGNEVGVPGAGAAIFQPAALLFILSGASGVPPITYTGTTLLGMFQRGERITIPGNATNIIMTYPVVLVDSFLVDFGL